MGFFKNLVRKALEEQQINVEALRKEFTEAKQELGQVREELTYTQNRLNAVKKEGMPIKGSIDVIMTSIDWIRLLYFDFGREIHKKTLEFNRKAEDWQERPLEFSVSPDTPFGFKVTHGFGLGFKAIKYIEGDGYGKYYINVNGVDRSWFIKRKDGEEDGALFMNMLIYAQADDIIEVKQVNGKGTLKCALYCIVAGEKKALYTDKYYEVLS